MESKQSALVLRHYGKKLSLLTQEQGHIQVLYFASFNKSPLSPGTLIECAFTKTTRGQWCIDQLVLEDVPFGWARADIQFLHYLLEICYFFMPVNSGGHCELFLFLVFLYKKFQVFKSSYSKKLVVCKLFAHLGIIADQLEQYQIAQVLLRTDVDKMVTTPLQLIAEGALDDWIIWSIKQYPQGKWLKALPLLVKSE